MTSRTLWECKLRKMLEPTFYPDKVLTSLCQRHYTVITLVPPIFGYVIPLKSLGFTSERYFFAIFVKTPDCRRIVVSEQLYSSFQDCSDKLNYYLRQTPLFCFSSRFLF